MTVFITAPTRFAQVSKLSSFNTGAFPSGREADNKPSLKTTTWIHKYLTEITAYTKSALLLYSQDKRAEAAILFDCVTQTIAFYPDTLESSWKARVWFKCTEKVHRTRGTRNVPVAQRICRSGSSPSFTVSRCRQLFTPQVPTKQLRNPPQNLPLRCLHVSPLAQWSNSSSRRLWL